MSLRSVWNFVKSRDFDSLLALVLITLAIGTVFYNIIEGWTWIDSLYFSVISLTTVGYGDITPVTTAGRVFTMFYLFIGIGILLGFINTVARKAASKESTTKYLKEKIKRQEKRKIKKKMRKKLKSL